MPAQCPLDFHMLFGSPFAPISFKLISPSSKILPLTPAPFHISQIPLLHPLRRIVSRLR